MSEVYERHKAASDYADTQRSTKMDKFKRRVWRVEAIKWESNEQHIRCLQVFKDLEFSVHFASSGKLILCRGETLLIVNHGQWIVWDQVDGWMAMDDEEFNNQYERVKK